MEAYKPIFTPAQAERWLAYIEVPEAYRSAADFPVSLEALAVLQTYQLSKVPYENLSIHYSKEHKVELDQQLVYRKIIGTNRGGYCLENNVFLYHMLKTLGFDVYLAGARVRNRVNGVPVGDFMGWVHVINLITLADGSRFAVDVGFGGDGPIRPMPLITGNVEQNIGTQQLRLVHGQVARQTVAGQRYWIFEYRNRAEDEWRAFYHFTELEFLAGDFAVMNAFTSGPESFLQTMPIILKMLRRDGEIYGKLMLAGADIKRNTGGRTELVKACRTESERVTAIKEYFDIDLTEEQVQGIQGFRSELPRDLPTKLPDGVVVTA